MMKIILGLVLLVAVTQATDCDDFLYETSYAACDGLTPQKDIEDETSCWLLCASDCDCDVWMWCPPDPNGSGKHCDGYRNNARCQTGKATNDTCRPPTKGKVQWIGYSRKPLVPQTTRPVTKKRGFSGFLGDTYDCMDAHALGVGDSWYYTWLSMNTQHDDCYYQDKYWGTELGAEFVPMVIGLGAAEQIFLREGWQQEWERSNVQYLLGYNEPDPEDTHPHSMTPLEGAEYWPEVQKVADMFDPPLTLVSPAPSSENFTDDGVSGWLDAFFDHCDHDVPECDSSRIEIIAWHDYRGDADKLERRINGMAKHYGRPLWLTEFALGRWDPPDGPSREEENKYLVAALEKLEANDNMERYVWFASRSEPGSWAGTKDLLPWDEQSLDLTSTGLIWKNYPKKSTSAWSDWSKCSVSCGNGVQTRTRTCDFDVTDPNNCLEADSAYDDFDGKDYTDQQTCRMDPCSKVDAPNQRQKVSRWKH